MTCPSGRSFFYLHRRKMLCNFDEKYQNVEFSKGFLLTNGQEHITLLRYASLFEFPLAGRYFDAYHTIPMTGGNV